MSLAKIKGLSGLIIGAVIAVFATLFGGLLGVSGISAGLLFGIIYMVIIAVAMFLGGAIEALLFNFVVKKVGGVEIEIEDSK
jgi:hypothetical protein